MPVFDAGVFDSNVVDAAAGGDTTAPLPNITVNPSRSKISSQAGVSTSAFTFTVDEAHQAYQLRVVPAETSPVTLGTLIESGGSGLAGVARAVDVTAAELQAAGLADGQHRVKVFAQDNAGNWSI